MLVKERKYALEDNLSEKKDSLTHLNSCLAWLRKAETRLHQQKPIGSEYSCVNRQYETHQNFCREVKEWTVRVEEVAATGRKLTGDSLHWPQSATEKMATESIMCQYQELEEKWPALVRDVEDWSNMLKTVLPEMKRFQGFCTECGQKLTEAEMAAANFQPVSTRMSILQQQMRFLQRFDAQLVSVGDLLGSAVASQQKQIRMGVKTSPELIEMVKRYHQRWNGLKTLTTERRATLEHALVVYNPETIGVAELPRGWQRAKTEAGTPYYVSNAQTQWQHPELSQFYQQLERTHGSYPCYPSPSYPTALKLRAIQKKVQLNLLWVKHAEQTFAEHQSYADAHRLLSCSDMTALAVGMYQHVQRAQGSSGFYINKAVELTVSWIRDVYDISHKGYVPNICFQTAIILLSHGKLEEKYKAIFRVISRDQNSIGMDNLARFLDQASQIAQSVSADQHTSSLQSTVCARECFKKYVGVGRLEQPKFTEWMQTEPDLLAWLPVLHRVIASETIQHDVKCDVCKQYPIVGFRYRCLKCSDFNLCQTCYWSGKTTREHDRSTHLMEEYCIARSSQDDVKEFFKTIHNSFKRKGSKTDHQRSLTFSSSSSSSHSSSTSAGTGALPDSAPFRRQGSRRSPPARRKHSISSIASDSDSSVLSGSSTLDHHVFARGISKTDVSSPVMQRTVPLEASTPDATSLDVSPRQPPNRMRLAMAQDGPKELDIALSKLALETKSLSQRLRDIKERRGSHSPPPPAPEEEGGDPASLGVHQRKQNALLKGRVQLLQGHNQRLETTISQLKRIADVNTSELPNGTNGTPVYNRKSLV